MTSNRGTKGIMKNCLLSTLGITALGLALLPMNSVQAEQNHFYLQGDIGGTSASDVKLKEFFGQPIAANSEISLDPGVRVGIRGGYGVTDWLAAEIETGVSANDIDTITGATQAEGSIANVPLLLNLRLQVPEKNRISPYVGAGFGLSSTVLSGEDIIIGGTRYDGTTADAVFAWQGFAGLRFAINDQMGLSVEYRYFRAEASNMTADITIGTPTDRVKLGRTETHSLSVAFDVRF